MLLKKAEILEFRSIKKETISFDPQFRILVGINESGKTNVLKALNLLSKNISPQVSDERTPLPDENDIDIPPARVIFSFEIQDEKEKIKEDILSKIYNLQTKGIIKNTNETLHLTQILDSLDNLQYIADISNEKKFFEYTFSLNLKKRSDSCPPEFRFKNKDGEEINPFDYEFFVVTEEEEKNFPGNLFDNVSLQEFFDYIKNTSNKILEDSLPEVVFWEYKPEQLLKDFVNLQDFITNPDISIPLRNMFYLANIHDIPKYLENKMKRGKYSLGNSLESIATKSTNYFKSKWEEYKDVKFSLQLDGENISCGITEKNKFSIENRSDGFKRFIAFLLSISCQNRIKSLKNALILIDEPDNGLHPSGIRYLRDELKEISKNNIVICCTHSIFMIDKNNIARHIIVEKHDEITKLEMAKEDNILKEEVLYQALHYSLFELLAEINILFEGWLDVKLFKVAISKNSNIAKYFKKIGIGYTQGAETFKCFIPPLELAGRKVLIISDGDEKAKKEKALYEEIRYLTPWKLYSDIDPNIQAITGEDFLKKDYLSEKLNKLLKKYKYEFKIEKKDIPDSDVLSYIRKIFKENSIKISKTEKFIGHLKDSLFSEDLKIENIKDSYFDLLKGIKKFIEDNINKND